MAKIKNTTAYPTVTPNASDLLIATDVSDNNKTVTFLVSDLLAAGTVLQDLQSVLTTGDTAVENINLTGTIDLQGTLNLSATSALTIANSGGTAGQVLAKNSANTGLEWANQVGGTLTWQDTLTNGSTASSNPTLTGIFNITDGGVAGTGGFQLSGTSYLNVEGLTTFKNHVTFDDGIDANFSGTSQINVNSTFGTAGQFLAVNSGATGMEWTSAPSQTTPNISAVLAAGNDTLGQSMSITDAVLSLDVDSFITSASKNTFSGNNTFSANGTTTSGAGIYLTGTLFAGISGTGLNGQVLTCVVDSGTGITSTEWASVGGSQTLQAVLNVGNTATASGSNSANISLTGNGTGVASATNGIFTIQDGTLSVTGNSEISLSGDVGTAGYSLVSGGPNAAPTWSNVTGGGGGTVTSVTGTTLPFPNTSNYVDVSTDVSSPTPVISTSLITDGTVTGGLDTDFYNAKGAFSIPAGADWNFNGSKVSTTVTLTLSDDSSTPRTTSFSLTEGTGISLTQSGEDVTVSYSGSAGITSLGLTSSTLDLTQTPPNTNPATSNGSIDVNLSATAVVAGAYTSTNLTVDAYGRITAAASGSPTNTTYTVDVPTATTNINLKGSDGTDDAITLVGGTNITITRDSDSQLTFSAPSAAGMTSWILSGDSGGDQTITNGDTVNILGGTYLASVASVTDTLTLDISATGTPTGRTALMGDNTWINTVLSLSAPVGSATLSSGGVTGAVGTATYDTATGDEAIALFQYGGTTNIGLVPDGGSGTTFLRGDGTWATPSGSGTVTSVALAGGTTGLSSTGGPITGSGTLTLGGTLAETHGGTNQTTYTTGDILYASGTNTLAKLALGTTGQVLKVSGGLPAWQADADSGGTVTSVGLSYLTTGGSQPDGNAAFLVSGSPVTSTGALTMTARGSTAQYINGAGKLTTFPTIGVGTVTDVTAGTLDGVSLTITNSTTTPTLAITNTDKGSAQNIFKNIGVSGGSTITADQNNDTATFTGGTGITLTANALTDTITIDADNNGTVTGTGTEGYVTRWSAGGTAIQDSLLYINASLGLAALNNGTNTNAKYTLTLGGDTGDGNGYINVANSVSNVRIGSGTLAETGSAQYNTIVGKDAALGITSGSNNTVIGYGAYATATVQTNNTIIGDGAMSLGYGGRDVAIGKDALKNGVNLTPSISTDEETGRVAIGSNAMSGSLQTGLGNIAIGSGAGKIVSTTAAGGAVYVGYNAGGNENDSYSGINQIAIGKNAMQKKAVDESIAIGVNALQDVVAGNIGGTGQIAIGKNAMSAATVTGNTNIAIGNNANNTTAIVADNISIGRNSTAKGTGSISIGEGADSGGAASADYGIAIGAGSLATGNYGMALGQGANVTDNYSVAIGFGATSTQSNQLTFGTVSQNLGTVATQSASQTHVWSVQINGTTYNILMAVPD